VWIIVDNGSTDSTPQTMRELAEEHEWIELASLETSREIRRGAPVVEGFHAGHDLLEEHYDVVVKLDADVSMDSGHFEHLLETFERRPMLGIASGTCLERGNDGTWQPRFVTGDAVWGAVRAYRAACLHDVLPLASGMGWDGIDVLRATMRGWETATLPDLTFRHHRREGERDGRRRRAWAAQGRASHFMGYRAWYLALRAIHHARSERAALWMLVGYASAALGRAEQYEDPEVRRHLRAQQRIPVLALRLRETTGTRQS
jgi:hypothetical protein